MEVEKFDIKKKVAELPSEEFEGFSHNLDLVEGSEEPEVEKPEEPTEPIEEINPSNFL